jgi:hypothetical protein
LSSQIAGKNFYADDALPGFAVHISQGGTRSFVLVHGRGRQFTTVGRYGVIGLADARKRAREILARQVLGKIRAPTHMNFGEVVEEFLTHHHGRPKTVKEYRRLIYKHFMPRLRPEPIERIQTARLTKIVDKLTDTRKIFIGTTPRHSMTATIWHTALTWLSRPRKAPTTRRSSPGK